MTDPRSNRATQHSQIQFLLTVVPVSIGPGISSSGLDVTAKNPVFIKLGRFLCVISETLQPCEL